MLLYGKIDQRKAQCVFTIFLKSETFIKLEL